MIMVLRIAKETLLRPACPARLAAVMAPTSWGRAHSHRTADPSDTGLPSTDKKRSTHQKGLRVQGKKSIKMKQITGWV